MPGHILSALGEHMTVDLELQPELVEAVALGNCLDLVVALGNHLDLVVALGNRLVLDIQQKQLVARGNQFDLDILLDLVLDIHLVECFLGTGQVGAHFLDNLPLVPGGNLAGVGRGIQGRHLVEEQSPQLSSQLQGVPHQQDILGLQRDSPVPPQDSLALSLDIQNLLVAWHHVLGGSHLGSQHHLLEPQQGNQLLASLHHEVSFLSSSASSFSSSSFSLPLAGACTPRLS